MKTEYTFKKRKICDKEIEIEAVVVNIGIGCIEHLRRFSGISAISRLGSGR